MLTANAVINGVTTAIIIDTGSEHNIISKNQATSIDTQQTIHLLAVGNTRVVTLGKTIVKLHLGKLPISCTAVVVENLPIPLIIGMRTLTNLGAIINLKNNELQLHSDGQRYTVNLNSTNCAKTNCLSLVRAPSDEMEYRNKYHAECIANIKHTVNQQNLKSESCEITGTLSAPLRLGVVPCQEDTQKNNDENKVIVFSKYEEQDLLNCNYITIPENPKKVFITKDCILDPGIETTIPVDILNFLANGAESYYFTENIKNIPRKSLVVMSNIDEITKEKEMVIFNKNHQKIKLFKNSTIGFLNEIRKDQENWTFVVSEEKEKVTIKDFDIMHIKDKKFEKRSRRADRKLL